VRWFHGSSSAAQQWHPGTQPSKYPIQHRWVSLVLFF
jgi:hypothetical protein